MLKDCGAASLRFLSGHRGADLATAVAPVPGALGPGQDHLAGHPLAVRRQANVAHEVDETRGQVQPAAELTGCVVVREGMVVVVESFACERKKNRTAPMEALNQKSTLGPRIFSGADRLCAQLTHWHHYTRESTFFRTR